MHPYIEQFSLCASRAAEMMDLALGFFFRCIPCSVPEISYVFVSGMKNRYDNYPSVTMNAPGGPAPFALSSVWVNPRCRSEPAVEGISFSAAKVAKGSKGGGEIV